jgi:hypothetical protein
VTGLQIDGGGHSASDEHAPQKPPGVQCEAPASPDAQSAEEEQAPAHPFTVQTPFCGHPVGPLKKWQSELHLPSTHRVSNGWLHPPGHHSPVHSTHPRFGTQSPHQSPPTEQEKPLLVLVVEVVLELLLLVGQPPAVEVVEAAKVVEVVEAAKVVELVEVAKVVELVEVVDPPGAVDDVVVDPPCEP